MNRTAAVLAGAFAGGAVWGALEVLWVIARFVLPFDVPHKLIPPRNLVGFVAVSLATYVVLGTFIGIAASLALRRPLARLGEVGRFATGFCLSWGGLAALATVVWVSMSLPGRLITPTSLAMFGVGFLIVIVLCGAAAWGMTRTLRGLRDGILAVGVMLPLALLGLAWLAHGFVEFAEVPERGTPRAGLPNIVLVTIDTLRADEVGAYSTGPVRTPFLDRLAAEGTRFERAISHVPTTTPSHVSIFTSLYPFAHGAENGVPLHGGLPTITTALRAAGYHTAAFVSAYTTKSNSAGLGPGFDVYQDSLHPRIGFLAAAEVEPLVFWRLVDRMSGYELSAEVVNRRVLAWLESGPERPYFLWVHYFDPHRPYDPKPGYGELYTPKDESRREQELALYRAEITYTDHELGVLVDAIRKTGALENGIVIVTSDHGQGFGEEHEDALWGPSRIEWGHGRFLYDAALRVPLIFWGPGRIPAGRVISAQVEGIDIAPTLLRLVGAEVPAGFQGRSLTDAFDSQRELSDKWAFSQNSHLYKPSLMALRSGEWKLIINPSSSDRELYDLAADPGEKKNLASERPRVTERLQEEIDSIVGERAGEAKTLDLDPATLERLRGLGYVPDPD